MPAWLRSRQVGRFVGRLVVGCTPPARTLGPDGHQPSSFLLLPMASPDDHRPRSCRLCSVMTDAQPGSEALLDGLAVLAIVADCCADVVGLGHCRSVVAAASEPEPRAGVAPGGGCERRPGSAAVAGSRRSPAQAPGEPARSRHWR